MNSFGRSLMILGAVIFATGMLLTLGDRLPWRLGRLPGDFSWRGRNWTVYFPLASSIAISVVISLLLWLWNRK